MESDVTVKWVSESRAVWGMFVLVGFDVLAGGEWQGGDRVGSGIEPNVAEAFAVEWGIVGDVAEELGELLALNPIDSSAIERFLFRVVEWHRFSFQVGGAGHGLCARGCW